MKKTLIAIMALAGLASAADSNPTWTFNTKTGTSGSGGYSAFSFTLNSIGTRYSITPSDVNVPLSTNLDLTSITYSNIKYNNGESAKSYTLVITDSSRKVLGYSAAENVATTNSTVTFDTFNTAVDGTGTALTLKSGTNYQAWFIYTDQLSTAISSTTGVLATSESYGIVRAESGLTKVDNSSDMVKWGLIGGNDGNVTAGDYAPQVSIIVTKSIPEPTTATLSLLALAGLAARRRRK